MNGPTITVLDVVRHDDPSDRLRLEATVQIGEDIRLCGVRLYRTRGQLEVRYPGQPDAEGRQWLSRAQPSTRLHARIVDALLPLLIDNPVPPVFPVPPVELPV